MNSVIYNFTKNIIVEVKVSKLRLRSPDRTFFGWVHRRTDRTVPVLCELWRVGERTVDSEDCWRVGVSENLVLQSCRAGN